MKGNERISARVQEIVGRAAEQAEVSLERTLRELAAIAFSDITKAVTWGVHVREEEDGRGERVKVIVNTVSLVPSGRRDEDTAAAISAVSQSSTGAVRIKMHNKLPALVAPLGKRLGMFDKRPQFMPSLTSNFLTFVQHWSGAVMCPACLCGGEA